MRSLFLTSYRHAFCNDFCSGLWSLHISLCSSSAVVAIYFLPKAFFVVVDGAPPIAAFVLWPLGFRHWADINQNAYVLHLWRWANTAIGHWLALAYVMT